MGPHLCFPAKGNWGLHLPCHIPTSLPAPFRLNICGELLRTSEKRVPYPQSWGTQTIPTLASSDLPEPQSSLTCGAPWECPPQHGHTYAHNCHAQMARQPLAFHLDLQKDSHGVYTFLLVPWKPCVSLRSTCSQRFCLCLCLVQGQSCCLWGHGLMWWTWQTTLKWLWRFQPGKISQG